MFRRCVLLLLMICPWLTAGCRWAGLHDPVPATLSASRKLSSEGNELLEQKHLEEGEKRLAEAVRVCPEDCDARRYYAEALWSRNAQPEAVAQLEEACRLKSEPEIHVRLAEMYLEMGRLDEAAASVDRALSKNLKLAGAWRVRGRILRQRGDRLLAAGDRDQADAMFRHALANLHRAAGYDPSDRQVAAETAAVYRSLGQPQRALESMQDLAETFSPGEEPQDVLFWTGLDYMALHRYDDAATCLATAAAREHPSSELLHTLARAQIACGRAGDAALSLQRALAVNPQHTPSRQLLGEILTAQQGGTTVLR